MHHYLPSPSIRVSKFIWRALVPWPRRPGFRATAEYLPASSSGLGSTVVAWNCRPVKRIYVGCGYKSFEINKPRTLPLWVCLILAADSPVFFSVCHQNQQPDL
jgi:hypothetical protein